MKGTIKQWRMFRGKTLDELAADIGRSKQTLINWEKGASEPTASDIAKIEKALDITWSEDVILMPKGLR